MNVKLTAVTTAISFFILTGTAMAEVQQGQTPDATQFLQSDEVAEFAAYEFEADTVEHEVISQPVRKNVSQTDEIHDWQPEEWSEIP